jgi:3-phosphoshikimate 1-carboxyvinyltransferase
VPSGIDYRRKHVRIEGDASSASYFFAAGAVTGSHVRVRNLRPDSPQGDIRFLEILRSMGCRTGVGGQRPPWVGVWGPASLSGVDVDMRDCSDVALTLATVALFAKGRTRIRGIGNLRVKETDRIAVACKNLRRIGAGVAEGKDSITILPKPVSSYRPTVIDTARDHRMAMSFTIAGLRIPGIEIPDPACVAKTYPDFFRDLDSLRQ